MNDDLNNTLISIIMPAYDAEQYIAESIQSVLRQTYALWELIIVDDCSKDHTQRIIERYAQTEPRIKPVFLKRNAGVAKARNAGIKTAQGRYIAFLDSDDLWLPTKLERQVQFMQEREAAISCTQYRQFLDSVERCGHLIDVETRVNYKKLLHGNVLGCLTVMLDRKYIPDLHMATGRHEDYITWLGLLKDGQCAYGLKEDLARYRKNINSLSGNKLKSLAWTWNVYRKSERLSIIRSSYYFFHYVLKGLRKHY